MKLIRTLPPEKKIPPEIFFINNEQIDVAAFFKYL